MQNSEDCIETLYYNEQVDNYVTQHACCFIVFKRGRKQNKNWTSMFGFDYPTTCKEMFLLPLDVENKTFMQLWWICACKSITIAWQFACRSDICYFPPCYYLGDRPSNWKNKIRMFCLPPATVTGTVSQMCYSPSGQQMSLFDNSSLSRALYSACARSWPEVIDSRLAPECYFVLLKVSLERARSCLPLCLPHATWTCSPRSSRYTTLAWRWDTSHSVLP